MFVSSPYLASFNSKDFPSASKTVMSTNSPNLKLPWIADLSLVMYLPLHHKILNFRRVLHNS